MALLKWCESFKTGFDDIDQDHKQIINQLNLLHDALASGAETKDQLANAVTALSEYVRDHFGREEDVIRAHPYPGKDNHFAQHRKFTEYVSSISNDLKNNKKLPETALVVFLVNWFFEHIKKIDMHFLKAAHLV